MMDLFTNGQINNWSFWLVKVSHDPLVKKIVLELICPKLHFGQIGQGGKKIKMGVFLIDFSNKKDFDFL